MKPLDLLSAITVPAIWGLGFTFSKGVLDQFPPIFLVSLRFSLTALVLAWFFPLPKAFLKRILLISLTSVVIQYSLTYTGLDGLDASTAILVIQLEIPFAALIAAIFLKDYLGWRRVLGMMLAFAGIGLIVGEPRVQESWIPLLLVLGGGFVWAIGQVQIKMLGGQVSGFVLITWVAILSAPQLFACSLIFESGHLDAIANADWRGWAVILYLGLIMNGLGYAMWYRLLGKYKVNQVMPFMLLVPVTSVVGAVLLLGEELTLLVALGGLIVIGGVAIIIVRRPKLVGPSPEGTTST